MEIDTKLSNQTHHYITYLAASISVRQVPKEVMLKMLFLAHREFLFGVRLKWEVQCWRCITL